MATMPPVIRARGEQDVQVPRWHRYMLPASDVINHDYYLPPPRAPTFALVLFLAGWELVQVVSEIHTIGPLTNAPLRRSCSRVALRVGHGVEVGAHEISPSLVMILRGYPRASAA